MLKKEIAMFEPVGDAQSAEKLLLLLDSRTWDEPNEQLAKEVKYFLEHEQKQVVLVHAATGINNTSGNAHANSFSTIRDKTPEELIKAGLYNRVSIAFRQGPDYLPSCSLRIAHALYESKPWHARLLDGTRASLNELCGRMRPQTSEKLLVVVQEA